MDVQHNLQLALQQPDNPNKQALQLVDDEENMPGWGHWALPQNADL